LILKKASFLILILLVCILCLRQTREPDVWWQIRTGQYILENGYVPQTDIFSFTYEGEPWTNVKWGSEVLFAKINSFLGVEGLMLLQLVVLLLILFFLKKSAKTFGDTDWKNSKGPPISFFLAAMIFLFLISFRLNGRPEMISHLFTAIFLFALLHFWRNPSWKIAFLIPVQLLWANLHEGYGIGMVLTGLFLVGLILEFTFSKNWTVSDFKTRMLPLVITAPFLWLVNAIHPSGFKMLGYFVEILSQLKENQFTTELYGFQEAQYWNFPAYIFLFVLLLSLFQIFRRNSHSKKSIWMRAIENVGLPYLIILAAFLYLSLGSYRNIPFFGIIAFPLLVGFFDRKISESKKNRLYLLVFGLLLYGYVGSGQYYQHFLEREHYGLRVNPEATPIGHAAYLRINDVQGKGFVDYILSSYLLYALQPDYKSYLDLRDLDVFEKQFMQNVILSYGYPDLPTQSGKPLFRFIDEADSFNYVLIGNKPEFYPLQKFLSYSDSTYVLVYADPVASLFLKKNEANKTMIEGVKSIPKKELFRRLSQVKTPAWARVVSKIFWPFYEERDFSKVSVGHARSQFFRGISSGS
jgi:hypothetical protein